MHQLLLLRRNSQPTPTSLNVVDEEQQRSIPSRDDSEPLLHQTPKQLENAHGTKRKRSGAEIQILNEPILDFVTKGLITVERAMSYFRTWVCHVLASYLNLELIMNMYCRFFNGCVG